MPEAKNKAPRVEPIVAVGVIEGFTPPPKPMRAGSGATKYPFDSLEIGQYFSVRNKTRRQMVGPVSNANKKYRSEAQDETGKVVSTTQEREFYVIEVDAATAKTLKGTTHDGASVLIVRSA